MTSIIEACGLSKSYGSVAAVSDVVLLARGRASTVCWVVTAPERPR